MAARYRMITAAFFGGALSLLLAMSIVQMALAQTPTPTSDLLPTYLPVDVGTACSSISAGGGFSTWTGERPLGYGFRSGTALALFKLDNPPQLALYHYTPPNTYDFLQNTRLPDQDALLLLGTPLTDGRLWVIPVVQCEGQLYHQDPVYIPPDLVN